jgi:hypothetical protein
LKRLYTLSLVLVWRLNLHSLPSDYLKHWKISHKS